MGVATDRGCCFELSPSDIDDVIFFLIKSSSLCIEIPLNRTQCLENESLDMNW